MPSVPCAAAKPTLHRRPSVGSLRADSRGHDDLVTTTTMQPGRAKPQPPPRCDQLSLWGSSRRCPSTLAASAGEARLV
nr:unnamed protein product [Digitaria exilis]